MSLWADVHDKGLRVVRVHTTLETGPYSQIVKRMQQRSPIFRSISMNKASGGDEIPAELFKILKNDAV